MFNRKEQQVQNTRDFNRCTSVVRFSSSKTKTIFWEVIFCFFTGKGYKNRRDNFNWIA